MYSIVRLVASQLRRCPEAEVKRQYREFGNEDENRIVYFLNVDKLPSVSIRVDSFIKGNLYQGVVRKTVERHVPLVYACSMFT